MSRLSIVINLISSQYRFRGVTAPKDGMNNGSLNIVVVELPTVVPVGDRFVVPHSGWACIDPPRWSDQFMNFTCTLSLLI